MAAAEASRETLNEPLASTGELVTAVQVEGDKGDSALSSTKPATAAGQVIVSVFPERVSYRTGVVIGLSFTTNAST